MLLKRSQHLDMTTAIHVRDSVRQIDSTSWLVGRTHVLRHIQGPYDGDDCLWKSTTTKSCYTLSPAPSPPPATIPLPPDGTHARQIHDAGDASAVFSFGDEIIVKVRIACDGTRREPETLAFLSKQQQLGIDIPTVLFYAEDDGKTYLCEPHVRGRRLNEAWWDMGEAEKEAVVSRVAGVCQELRGFSAGERVVVVDWEMAGYMPLEWVRTKFAVCGVLRVERGRGAALEVNQDYRARVERRLGEIGFPEVTEAYREMMRARKEE
jgi:hypothetical protein